MISKNTPLAWGICNQLYMVHAVYIMVHSLLTTLKSDNFHKSVQRPVVLDLLEDVYNLQYNIVHLCLAAFSFPFPLYETPFSWWSRNKWNKTPATKYRSHEGIIKLTPVIVNCVCRGGQECTYASWSWYIKLRIQPLPKKWHRDWFWSRWIWHHHAGCLFWTSQEPYKRFSHQPKHLTRIIYEEWLPSLRKHFLHKTHSYKIANMTFVNKT